MGSPGVECHPVKASFRLLSMLVLGSAVTAFATAGNRAAQSYVVVLKPDTPSARAVADELARGYGGRVDFVYEHALKGFSITVPPLVATALASNPRVVYVEEDLRWFALSQSTPTGIRRIFRPDTIPIDGSDKRVDVGVAVLDTGIDWEHPDLNVVGGINCASGSVRKASCSGNGDDDHYHGTHVAGTIAALDNGIGVVGIAPGARLYAVKVLDSELSGHLSWVIAGIDWVTARSKDIAVANMSLGRSGYSQAGYDAIQGAVNKGVAFAVAAGNFGDDAGNYSPAAFNNVLTVSALADFDGKPGYLHPPTCRTDEDDTLANFSNWGSAVNIAAPGVCIRSTYPIDSSRGSYANMSGTSTASPHVAGALALLASKKRATNATGVHALYKQVLDAGNFDWSDESADNIREPLLDISNSDIFSPRVLAADSPNSGPVNQPPSSSFTSSCQDLVCVFTDTSTDEGSIVAWAWAFGDSSKSTTKNPQHTYTSAGTFQVTLTVTDNAGATGSSAGTVSVSAAQASAFPLTVNAYKTKNICTADLAWSGAAASKAAEIFRNGSRIAVVTSNATGSGAFRDSLGKGSLTVTYHVCSEGNCSDVVSATW
jgi:subtilisin